MQLAEAKQLGLKILIFGGYGTGKTHFSSTLPQPIYFFDTDKGITTVSNRIKNEKRDPTKELIDFDLYSDGVYLHKRTKSIMTSLIRNINPNPTAYLSWEDKLGDFIEMAIAGTLPFNTVVFDSLTTLSRIFTNYIMFINQDQGRMFGNANLNDMGNYIRKMPELLGMIHMLSDYGVHTVVTAHMQLKENIRGLKKDPTEKDSKDQLEFYGTFRLPAVIGKDLPFNIGNDFDEVYFSYVERYGQQAKYMFETKGDKDLLCKSRSSLMPITIEQDWNKISKHLGVSATMPPRVVVKEKTA